MHPIFGISRKGFPTLKKKSRKADAQNCSNSTMPAVKVSNISQIDSGPKNYEQLNQFCVYQKQKSPTASLATFHDQYRHL